MIKLVLLFIALAVGFGGGVYWAHHNPDAAGRLAAAEEKRFIEAQIALNNRLKEKLLSLEGKATASKSGGSSFLSSGQGAAVAKEDVKALEAEAEAQEKSLRERLAKLSGG